MGIEEVTTSRGVPQGLSTSPLLFDIFVEPLLYRLQNAGIFSRMFADDLVCIAEDRLAISEAVRHVR